MKKFYLLTGIGLIVCFMNVKTSAQDKQLDFSIGNGVYLYNISQCGDDDFYLVYGKLSLSKYAEKNLMKFDNNFKQLWTEPVIFKGASFTDKIYIFSYNDTSGKTIASYIFGGEQFIQVLSDKTSKEKKTEIPEKELDNIAAVFTDSIGLNIITLTGEKNYITGNMKWYTFTHDNMTKKVKIITLAQPTEIDEKNESGWRLNCVTSTGLYFCYVSYKNDTKETTGPILAFNIVKVDYSGKNGSITTIDTKNDKYNIIPSYYTSNYKNMVANQPTLFTPVTSQNVNTGTTHTSYFHTDNAYMGVVIDEKSNLIYTCYATNDELKVKNDGVPKTDALGKSTLIKKLNINVYDLAGNDIGQSVLDYTATPLEALDECSYAGNTIDFYLLPGKEGLICKAVNNSNGHIYALDNNGALIEKNKIEFFSYKALGRKYIKDVLSSVYTSLKDFENSPYFLGSKSLLYQYYNKIEDKKQKYTSYLSLKSGEILLQWDGKEDKIKLSCFNKK